MLPYVIVASLMSVPSFATPAEDSPPSCTVELETLHELAGRAVPDDGDTHGRLEDWIRRALTARDSKQRLAGEVALQALHRLRALDFVYVAPQAIPTIEGAPKGWICRGNYDRYWGSKPRAGGTLLSDVITPSLFGWELSIETYYAIQRLERTGYRWNAETRAWEDNAALPKLDLKDNEP